MNGQIGTLSPNADAGSLEDQRQLAIAKLSSLVGLDQVTTENNGITLTTHGGAVLVEGQHAYALQAGSTATGAAVLDAHGVDVSAGIVGGSLGGKLAAQNVDVPGAAQALDALAYQVATIVNTQNAAGVTTGGFAGGAIFSVPVSALGSAASLAVAPGATVASAAVGEGATGNGNATKLARLVSAVGPAGVTLSGMLASLIGSVGTTASAVKVQASTQQATLTQLTTQRDSLSGVSLDEAAADLSQYEKSYQAAAKLLTVLDSLMAAAINIGTQTAVS